MTNPKEKKIKILVADDEEDIRLNLCDVLELEGFDILQATNGNESLNILKNETPDIIISDLMMPEKTGLEFLEEKGKRENKIPVIIMTAFGTIEYAVKAMKMGAVDFITKPIDYDYMFAVIKRVLRTVELEKKVQDQQQQMIEDLHLAGTIQKAVLPNPIDNQYLSFQFRFEPMIEIGGDHISMHAYNDEHITLGVFDVTGHGVSASIVANMVHNELINRLKQERPPSNVVDLLNRYVVRTIGDTKMFLTLILCDIDVASKQMTVCNAGHPDLMICREKDNTIERIGSHVPPVGFSGNISSDNMETKVQLNSGDRIVMYTDGFPETENKDGEQLRVSGFENIVEKFSRLRTSDFIDEVFKSTEEYQHGEPEDDRTLALVEVK